MEQLKSGDYKKMSKYAREEGEKVLKQFRESFSIKDYMKPCPIFIPDFLWNFLIWIVIKHN